MIGGTELNVSLGEILGNTAVQSVIGFVSIVSLHLRIDNTPQCLAASCIVKEYLILLQSGELQSRFRDVE